MVNLLSDIIRENRKNLKTVYDFPGIKTNNMNGIFGHTPFEKLNARSKVNLTLSKGSQIRNSTL